MPAHISVRLAWHDDGWNGHICTKPRENTFCVGPHSYPGDLIATNRKLSVEKKFKGSSCSEMFSKTGEIPPCCYSINAFGPEIIQAKAEPPEFFNDNTPEKIWPMPAYSVSTWPYEEMYKDEVKNPDGTYNNDNRRKEANKFFAALEPKKTLIFYYVNYSNPFSENEQNNYVIIGVARLAKPADEELLYDDCSEETKAKFADGFLWQRVLESNYPDEGFRIPYHLYRDRPEILERIGLIPENPRNFKYATRHVSDDEALTIIERLAEVAGTLKEIGDKTENWPARIAWLNSLIAELWQGRGKYPGLLRVLDFLGFEEAIQFYKNKVLQNLKEENPTKKEIFDFIKGETETIKGLVISDQKKRYIRRQWKLKEESQKKILEEVLPRFDLSKEQMKRILDEEKESHGLYSSFADITENPYILSEEYIGDDPDDFISFNKIDHGILLSPDLSEDKEYSEFSKDDPRRLRALCVEQLKNESQHTFVPAKQIINKINHKLSYLPEWKQQHFTIKYFEVDEEILRKSLVFREEKNEQYVYLKNNYEYEREIEAKILSLSKRSDIKITNSVPPEKWHSWLCSADNPICKLNPAKYEEIILEQQNICQKILKKPISVIYSGAGTGKTTVVGALIRAIEFVHGKGTVVQLLSPTGKATDRLRELTQRPASTIHSFLASHEWLNANFSFKRKSSVESVTSTVIIDESSMLDLPLLGTLFRAIDWTAVKRLVFVGDPNQLPPIGTGKVFADIVDWLQANHPNNVGYLKNNVRQLNNQLEAKGTGILDLASLYLRKHCEDLKDSETKFREEAMLRKVQQGGDIDKDLRVVFWKDPEDLNAKLLEVIAGDMENETGIEFDPEDPFTVWGTAFKIYYPQTRRFDLSKAEPDFLQVISPYRGEFFGIDSLNAWLQSVFNSERFKRGTLGGLTLFDKVIQYRNRTKSNPISAYDTIKRMSREVEIFNGEIGFVKWHAFDNDKWYWNNFRPFRFQVVFKRKEHLWISYYSKTEVEENLEPAYAISVHKSQGSEFTRVCFILPKHKKALLTTELFYTGLTRAKTHCTLFIEEDISPLLTLNRPEFSQLNRINSSLFEFKPIPEELTTLYEWYEEGKIHKTLSEIMVHSKSEVIIANMLFERGIPFKYDIPLFAADGTFYRPDFVITWNGEEWYWEHLGMLDKEEYKNHWEAKKEWYRKNGFSNKLITTDEKGGLDSKTIEELIKKHFC